MNTMLHRFRLRSRAPRCGLTLLEVMVAAVIFAVGLTALSTLFPRGTQSAVRAERNTRAAMLARDILEGLRADPNGYGRLCFAIGDGIDNDDDGEVDEDIGQGDDVGFIYGIILPGNGLDDEKWLKQITAGGSNPLTYEPLGGSNPYPVPLDADGQPEMDAYIHFVGHSDYEDIDNDNDNYVDDDGDSGGLEYNTAITLDETGKQRTELPPLCDGLTWYDPVVEKPGSVWTGADEEFADGIDNDGDGLIDEDLRLPSNRLPYPRAGEQALVYDFPTAGGHPVYETHPYLSMGVGPGNNLWTGRYFTPWMVGDGVDNDGDSTDNSEDDPAPLHVEYAVDADQDRVWPWYWPDMGTQINEPAGLLRADELNNDFYDTGDPRTDEGIDEEIFNGVDDDGDGLIDEDCGLSPAMIIPAGVDVGAWLSIPRRAFAPVRWPRYGNRQLDLHSTDADDEDSLALTGDQGSFNDQFFFQIFVGPAVDYTGDGIDNDQDADPLLAADDAERRKYIDEEQLDGIDNDGDGLIDEDVGHTVLPGYLRVKVVVTWGGDLLNNDVRDDDWFIDEEAPDGIDNDLDGLIDEDTWGSSYSLTGIIEIGQKDR